MKKILSLLWILMVATIFAGCSLVPTASPVEQQVQPPKVANLFNFDGLEYKEGEVLVKTLTPSALLNVTKAGSTLLKEWPELGWALISVPANETTLSYIDKLQKEAGIVLAQPNLRYTIDPIQSKPVVDPAMGEITPAAISTTLFYPYQWGFKNINAEPAWDITTGSSDVVVAIVDTGVQVNHDEFVNKTFVDPIDVTTGLTGLANMYDLNGHGTHVAGIAADDGATGYMSGVAWNCPIMPIRVEDDFGYIFTNYLIDAMYYLGDWAFNNPTKRVVANMSIGGRGYNFAFKDAIDYAFDKGVLLVTSAGNDTKRIVSYPSAYNGVVSVAASTPYDAKASFSTEGWWNSVAAPGVEILSTVPDSNFEFMQGTSMASPFVTGAAALLLSHNPTLTPLQVKNQIEMTARGSGFTEALGYGILNLEALLGPVQPMQYGSLDVRTNIMSVSPDLWVGVGLITVFDDMGNLAGFGTTGNYGNYAFKALKPGTYNVNVTYYDHFSQSQYYQSAAVNVAIDQPAVVDFTFNVPQSVNRTAFFNENLEITQEPFGQGFQITIAEPGFYEFITSPYLYTCDTVLYLLDNANNILTSNDDHLDQYSYIGVNLLPGTYVVVVQDFEADDPLYCNLSMYNTVITY